MLIKDCTFFIVDVETTGLDPEKDRVVEVASVMCSIGHGVDTARKRSHSFLVNPRIPIPASASAIHHITDADVAEVRRREIVLDDLKCNDSTSEFAFAAHNAEFDFAFLPSTGTAPICTCRLAKKLWPDLESYGNQFLRYHFNLPIPNHIKAMQMHRALPDAMVTAFLLLHELKEVLSRAANPDQADVERLAIWINEPILLTTIRFGKHKGEKWADVPRSYLSWILDKMDDADRDTLFTAEHYLRA